MNARDPKLDALRKELDEHDRKLVELIARRMEIVRKIGAVKRASGAPTFDRGREREVLARARAAAEALSLDPSLAEDIFAALMGASQLEQAAAVSGEGIGRRRLLAVGGKGRMARRLVALLGWPAAQVDIADQGDKLTPERIAAADVVMIAVPLDALGDVAREVAPQVRKDALLFDIGSLKGEVCGVFSEKCVGECVGLHPVFGPTVSSLSRQKFIVCPIREGALAKWFLDLLASQGAELVRADAAKHDRMMGAVQVLIHFNKFVVGSALQKSGISLPETLTFTSPVYRLELAVIGRIFAQDPRLYGAIQIGNPEGEAFRKLFMDAAAELVEVLRRGNHEAFEKRFSEVKDYFAAFSDEALAVSDKLIGYLVAHA
jgi:chorismate mutase/prephenate dehydrogenase